MYWSVESIDLTMVHSNYNSRALSGDMSAEDAFMKSLADGFLPAYDNPDKVICDLSGAVFNELTSHDTCGGSKRNIGTLFAISGSVESATHLQLGLDWGRGGFISLDTGGLAPEITRYNSDIWWTKKWDHGDVLNFIIPKTPEFLLIGLGFEGCCDGFNSARWRSPGESTPALFTQTLLDEPINEPGEWQVLAVNAEEVPVPGGIPLLGIGLLALAYSRRPL